MGHVGKYVPWSVKNRVVANGGVEAFFWPPSRKLSLNFNALGNTGTFCVTWAGLTVVTSEADYYSGDSTITTYTAVNPTDSAKTIECRFKFRQVPPTTSTPLLDLWDVNLIARDGATQVARHDFTTNYFDPWVNTGYNVQIGPGWGTSVGLPVFQNLVTRLRAANWAQQPEYHPYRH